MFIYMEDKIKRISAYFDFKFGEDDESGYNEQKH